MNKQLLYEGKKIAYRVIGTGKAVVLIHGFGEDAAVWKNQVDFFKDKFRLIIPDLPGTGQSELIDDMSMEGMAEVIKKIVDVEGSLPSEREAPLLPEGKAPLPPEGGFSESSNKDMSLLVSESKAPPSEGFGEAFSSGGRGACILIGHSMGGYITMAFAEKYPDRLSGFGLFHSSAFADSEEKKATRLKGIAFINEQGPFEFLKTATPNLFSPQTKNERAGLIDEQVAAGHNFSARTLVSYYEAMIKRPDRTGILEKTRVPVLFIMGKYDNAVPMEDGLKQCHLPGKSYIHVLQKSGHMGMLEETEKSNLALENFLVEI
ncbi:MAG: alpha/beta fold hydrolase [Chitinophagaceae bacterium]